MSSARVGHQIGQDRSSKRVRKGSPAVHRATNYQSSFKLKYGKYFTDRSYPTSQKFCREKTRITSLVAWLLAAPCALLIRGKAGGGWLDGDGDGEGQCSAAPRVFTQLLLAQLRWAAPESREQQRRADLNCERWRRAASPVPALPPPAYLPWCVICNTSRFYMPVLSGHHLVILHSIPSSFCWR